MKLLNRFFRDPGERDVTRARKVVDEINSLEADVKKLSDSKLKEQTEKLKKQLADGKKLNDILPEAFAIVREAAHRSLGQRHFDVQLIGGIILHEGKIAEMRTGEGKTLTSSAPVYLNALEGKGVHVVTVNDYLARRDAGWMGQVYHQLGMTTGVIVPGATFGVEAYLVDPDFVDQLADDERLKHLRPVSRREAYEADITYGTNNEFGFDYLRDNMVNDIASMVQKEPHYAIVDEVDSILIDEARTPLIISAPAQESTHKYVEFARLARQLKPTEDYTIDEKDRRVSISDEGIRKLEQALGVDNVYEEGRLEDVHHVQQSLMAEAIFKKDKDYVVRDGEILIVDEFTGRLMHGRRYSEGLHQAIEAKEGVEIKQESLTLATVTFQNYFRLYTKLAGMTGTAATEKEEFYKIYALDVAVIPTHRDNQRIDHQDKIYKTEAGKFRAIAQEVKERQAAGQPVLLGTVSIQKNEILSSLLTEYGVKHDVLNAKNNQQEAAIIAAAGRRGGVTLATNIAGRGTDIVLGDGVQDLGGLHVIGTERHESRRIDNQLRGRSGRQGDPGSTRFYVSLEDDLMRIFGGERVASLMSTLGLDDDTPLENKMVSKSLENAQKKVEGHNFDIRKQLVEYDDVMNKHREAIYGRRRRALEHANLRSEIEEMLDHEFTTITTVHTDARTGIMDKDKVLELVNNIMPLDQEALEKIQKADPRDVHDILQKHSRRVYDIREKEFTPDSMRLLERLLYLQIMDRLWIDHLEAMDGLREGIHLRAIGQRDPLVEYKREAFRLYNQLIGLMEGEITNTIFKAAITMQQAPGEQVDTAMTKAAKAASSSHADAPTAVNREQRRTASKQPAAVGAGSSSQGKRKKKRKR